jgi:hypothetical protein
MTRKEVSEWSVFAALLAAVVAASRFAAGRPRN